MFTNHMYALELALDFGWIFVLKFRHWFWCFFLLIIMHKFCCCYFFLNFFSNLHRSLEVLGSSSGLVRLSSIFFINCKQLEVCRSTRWTISQRKECVFFHQGTLPLPRDDITRCHRKPPTWGFQHANLQILPHCSEVFRGFFASFSFGCFAAFIWG